MSDVSIGGGIGLQSRPDTSGFGMAEHEAARKAQQHAGQIRAKQKEDEHFNAILKDVKVEGVHQLDKEEANHNIASFVDYALKEKQANPNNWLNSVEARAKQTMFNQAQFQQRNAELKKFEGQIEAQKAANAIVTPAQEELYKHVKTGKWDDINSLPPDPEQTVSYNPVTKSISANLIPNVDTSALEKTAINNPGFQTEIKTERDKAYRDLKGGTKDNISYSIPDEKIAEQAQILGSDNNYVKKKVHELRKDGRLPEGDQFFSLPPQIQAQKLLPLIKEDVRKQAPVKIEPKYNEPFAPHVSAASQGDEYGDNDVHKDLGFNGEDAVTNGMEEGQNYVAKGAKSFAVKKASIATPEGTIDAATGQPVKDAGVAKNYTIGSAQNVPIIIDGEHKGNRASEQYIKVLEHNKQDLSKYIRYETMTPAAYTEQVQETDQDGKLLTDANGAPVYKNIEKQVFLPAKAIHGTLESGKQPAKLGELVKRADEVNNSLKSTTSNSSRPKQVSSQSEYDAIPKGQSYISNGKTYVKK